MVIAMITGCGADPSPPPGSPGSPGTGRGSSAAAPAVAVTVQVSRGAVTVRVGPARAPNGRVNVRPGRTVRIVVTSDVAERFHLHGYDRELALEPGLPGVLGLVADQPGVFEAELHGSGARLFELRVG